ncbi:MAG: ParA family protein [Chloroflexota bacterium]
MRTLAVINHKGGAGKTTTSVNLAAAMGETGLKVLLLDLDPQGSASDWVGAHDDSRGMFDVFVGSVELSTLAQRTIVPGVDVIPASPWLVTAERTLLGDLAASFVRAVNRLPDDWDIVVADCPPSIAFLSVAALAAFREVLIPVETHAIALPGVASLVREMDQIRATLNPGLGPPHILAGRVNRTVHSREVLAELRETYGDMVLQATVRDSVRLAEAAGLRLPITLSAHDSLAASDFRAVAAEVLSGVPAAAPAPAREEQPAGGWRRWLNRPAVVR